MQPKAPISSRQALIETNVCWLRQALRLPEQMDDAAYSTTPTGFAPHRAGAHFRHIVELYQCFLDGLESSHIDYTAPRRDGAIECSRDAASTTIRRIIRSLQTHSELQGERIVWVRMEDPESGMRCFVESSVSRELQVLSSHTVHYSALIGMILRLQGFEMDPDFGMAPSTLRYLSSKTMEAA